MAVFGGTIKGGKISSGGSGKFRARTGSTPVKKKEKSIRAQRARHRDALKKQRAIERRNRRNK